MENVIEEQLIARVYKITDENIPAVSREYPHDSLALAAILYQLQMVAAVEKSVLFIRTHTLKGVIVNWQYKLVSEAAYWSAKFDMTEYMQKDEAWPSAPN